MIIRQSSKADNFQVQEEWKDRVALVAEDYLHGLITVVNELVRFFLSTK